MGISETLIQLGTTVEIKWHRERLDIPCFPKRNSRKNPVMANKTCLFWTTTEKSVSCPGCCVLFFVFFFIFSKNKLGEHSCGCNYQESFPYIVFYHTNALKLLLVIFGHVNSPAFRSFWFSFLDLTLAPRCLQKTKRQQDTCILVPFPAFGI